MGSFPISLWAIQIQQVAGIAKSLSLTFPQSLSLFSFGDTSGGFPNLFVPDEFSLL